MSIRYAFPLVCLGAGWVLLLIMEHQSRQGVRAQGWVDRWMQRHLSLEARAWVLIVLTVVLFVIMLLSPRG